MGSKRILILMIVSLVFLVGIVSADINYALKPGVTADCSSAYGTIGGVCSNIHDNDTTTYWGVYPGDARMWYEVVLTLPQPRDLNKVETVTTREAAHIHSDRANYFRISLYYGGGWHEIYYYHYWSHPTFITVSGNWANVEKIKVRDVMAPEGNYGKAYLRELRVFTECECISGECCDGCNFRPSTYECRAATGDCDVAETCTGTNADCPLDVFRPNTYECRVAIGDCDIAEYCIGTNADCPADAFVVEGASCGTCMECNSLGACISVGDYNHRRGEIIDTTDDACCDSNTDCVYSNLCYEEEAPYELDGETRYCDNGEWGIILEFKCDWNNDVCGYCDSNTKCMNPQGQCVNDGSFILDHICENGEWSTRTKLIALQLLDISNQKSPDDYTLFCDSYENTLNYYQYSISGIPVTQHLNEVNNICVLKLPNQVIFGTSLNQPINEGQFIKTLTDLNDCDDAIIPEKNDGNFHQCSTGASKAWYNTKTQSIIYTQKNIVDLPPDFELNFQEAFLTFLKNPFQIIFNFLLGLFEREPIDPKDYEFINSTIEFSRIYLNRQQSKSIKGIAEKITKPIGGEYISVTYEGYAQDICATLTKAYEKFRKEEQLGRKDLVICHYEPSTENYYVASNSSMALDLWPELTARLRPKGICPHIKAPATAIVDDPIRFDADIEWCNNPRFTYNWNFGDGTTDSGKTPTKTYTTLGEKTVTLTVTNSEGDSNTAILRINIVPPENCEVVGDEDLDRHADCADSDCPEETYCDAAHTKICQGGNCRTETIPPSCAELLNILNNSWHAHCGDVDYNARVDIIGANLTEGADCYIDVWDLMQISGHENDQEWCSTRLNLPVSCQEVLNIISASWHTSCGDDKYDSRADLDNDKQDGTPDCYIDYRDLIKVADYWGNEEWCSARLAFGVQLCSNIACATTDGFKQCKSAWEAGDVDDFEFLDCTDICRAVAGCLPPRELCGDETCDVGENCPADVVNCTDNVCYEPTCTNGCAETPVPEKENDEACTSPLMCDGSGSCVECIESNDCTSGEICQDRICVKPIAYMSLSMSRKRAFFAWDTVTARATVKENTASGPLLVGATVQGKWSGGYSATVSGTTNSNGQVSFSTGRVARTQTATFTINSITMGSDVYELTGTLSGTR